jgi:hypothetical protein
MPTAHRHPSSWLRALLMIAIGIAAALSGLPARAVEGDALVTLLDGDGRVLDRSGAFAAAEGLKVSGAALVQTGAGTKLLRLEWSGGSAVDLGPDTQLLVAPLGLADKPDKTRAALYLLRGWVKLSAAPGENPPQLLSLFSGALLQQGALVAFVGNGQAWIFDESGSSQIMERPARGNPLALGGGQFYTRIGADPGQVLPRAPAATLKDVPRAFRDTLPRRYAAAASKPATPRALAQPGYADLREWMSGESTVRRFVVVHFAHWARDPAFRSALAAQEKNHPEWSAILHPNPPRKP